MSIRDLTKKFLAEAKKRGLKIEKSFSVMPTIICSSEGCGGVVGELPALGFVSEYSGAPCCGVVSRMGVAIFCTKCKKLHNLDGTPFILAGCEVFLNKNGDGVVMNREGKIFYRFWTTQSKPPKLGKKHNKLIRRCKTGQKRSKA